jgi:uncharacterized short protein YbdD (DUF466 family)
MPPPVHHAVAAAARLVRRARRVLRAVVGAPDYEGYVTHCRAAGAPPLERGAFERERLAARYDRPGSRCC